MSTPELRWRPLLLIAVAVVLASGLLLGNGGPRAGAGGDEPAPPGTTVAGPAAATEISVVDNEFLPEDRNLTDCLGAVERPGCGSKARGGWRQGLTFALLVVGLVFIAWRIVRSTRRQQRADRPAPDDAEVRQ